MTGKSGLPHSPPAGAEGGRARLERAPGRPRGALGAPQPAERPGGGCRPGRRLSGAGWRGPSVCGGACSGSRSGAVYGQARPELRGLPRSPGGPQPPAGGPGRPCARRSGGKRRSQPGEPEMPRTAPASPGSGGAPSGRKMGGCRGWESALFLYRAGREGTASDSQEITINKIEVKKKKKRFR